MSSDDLRITAFREPVMEDLMLEYLERLRQLGFSTVVGPLFAWANKFPMRKHCKLSWAVSTKSCFRQMMCES